MTEEDIKALSGAFQRVFAAKGNTATPDDKFEVLVDLCDRYGYFFALPNTASEAELRAANAERMVIARIIQQSHEPGSDLLSRLFEAVVARRTAR